MVIAEQLLFLCRSGRVAVNAEKNRQRDLEQGAQLRDRVDIRPGNAVFPVADGIGAVSDGPAYGTLVHPGLFPVAAQDIPVMGGPLLRHRQAAGFSRFFKRGDGLLVFPFPCCPHGIMSPICASFLSASGLQLF